MSERLPLFPLNTLLVPESTLPLQIFEQRYLRLIKDCIHNNTSFGIVPIRDGNEVGQPAMIYQFGVTAEIIDWSQGDNGMLQIMVEGRRKFRVLQTTIEEDQLMQAQVEYLDEEPVVPTPEAYAELVELYDSLRKHPEVKALNMPEANHASQLGCFLLMLLPLRRPDQISLLALQDPVQRLKSLDDIL